MTKIGLYAIGTSTTLESNKSQILLRRRANHVCLACDAEQTRERRKAKREGNA